MSLVITVVSNHGLWQSTDHRLSSREGDVISDQSLKTTYLEAEDGKAMIAYAGVGRVHEMHISEWVGNVVKGKRRRLADHISVLIKAAERKLMPHSKSNLVPHTFSIAAYENSQPTLYVITNRIIENGKYAIGKNFDLLERRVPRNELYRVIINAEGVGALALSESETREIITKTISRRAAKPTLGENVGAVLARLNANASNDQRSEGLVSQHCIVTYLASPKDGYDRWFCGWDSEFKKPMLRHICGGFDVNNIVEAIAPIAFDHMTREREAKKKGEPFDEEIDIDALNELLRRNHKEPSDEFE